MSKAIDETGNRYGQLTVSKRSGISSGMATWHCFCDCGTWLVATGRQLRRGHIRSCGCLIEKAAKLRECNALAFNSWRGMRERCGRETHASFPNYGGRGITICEQWATFENFLEDMGPRPGSQYSLDRIDNEGNYTPENCRWATRIQQVRNARSNMNFTHNGKAQCLAAWAEELGIARGTLRRRIVALNWSVERAFSQPVRPMRRTQESR